MDTLTNPNPQRKFQNHGKSTECTTNETTCVFPKQPWPICHTASVHSTQSQPCHTTQKKSAAFAQLFLFREARPTGPPASRFNFKFASSAP